MEVKLWARLSVCLSVGWSVGLSVVLSVITSHALIGALVHLLMDVSLEQSFSLAIFVRHIWLILGGNSNLTSFIHNYVHRLYFFALTYVWDVVQWLYSDNLIRNVSSKQFVLCRLKTFFNSFVDDEKRGLHISMNGDMWTPTITFLYPHRRNDLSFFIVRMYTQNFDGHSCLMCKLRQVVP